MRKTILFLLLGIASAASASDIPFTGPGVNSAAQLLPVDKLRALGIRWVRADVNPVDLTEGRLKQFKNHYRGMPILWMISQKTPNAPEAALKLIDWGYTDLEIGNETELGIFNNGGQVWTGQSYGKWFATIRKAVGTRARLYGPVTSTWNPTFVQQAFDGGMRPDAVCIHGYGVPRLDSICQYARDRWALPVIVSEVGPMDQSVDAADAFLNLKRQMGEVPWCWYDGPNADWRGLFETHDDGAHWVPTTLYYRILGKMGG